MRFFFLCKQYKVLIKLNSFVYKSTGFERKWSDLVQEAFDGNLFTAIHSAKDGTLG